MGLTNLFVCVCISRSVKRKAQGPEIARQRLQSSQIEGFGK